MEEKEIKNYYEANMGLPIDIDRTIDRKLSIYVRNFTEKFDITHSFGLLPRANKDKLYSYNHHNFQKWLNKNSRWNKKRMQDKEKSYYEHFNNKCDCCGKTSLFNQTVCDRCELDWERQRMSACIEKGDVTEALNILLSEFTREEKK